MSDASWRGEGALLAAARGEVCGAAAVGAPRTSTLHHSHTRSCESRVGALLQHCTTYWRWYALLILDFIEVD